mgnify:FL=1
MIFDVYYPFYSKSKGQLVPGVKPVPMEFSRIKSEILASDKVKETIARHRSGDKTAKISLPAICFTGRSVSTRKNSAMIPTQYVMIDIDHCKDAEGAWKEIELTMGKDWIVDNVLLAHLTPSKGMHIFFKAQEGLTTLKANMDWFNEKANFGMYGDYDAAVHDFARISFAFLADEILFENVVLYLAIPPEVDEILVNNAFDPTEQDKQKPKENGNDTEGKDESVPTGASSSDIPQFTEEEKAKLDKEEYKATPLKEIIAAWVDYRGEPGANEIHNYYNEMVKYFRNIMGNNKRKIFYLLPRFGHTEEECWSQVKAICKSNTLSRLDREFYFFLLDRGFITARKDQRDTEYMLSEGKEEDFGDMPTPPPVIREFVRIAPKDFRIPTINALLPILGTLSSYVCARYPYDDRIHTTSFFSVIYGPPASGKGFVDRTDFLFDDLRIRDYVQSVREQIYLKALNRKGANEKSPEQPHVSLRIIPPKNSESEFLEKQRDNHGYHMFTYAAEMDSWAKGEKAAGGNKSDMIRIAWDNGIYGQQFKSAATFKGSVRLYWNVLITGTLNQVENYFRNVENGLASRCSFCEIENQEYQLAQIWKPIPKKGMTIIRNYMKRCDEATYEEPCNIVPSEIDLMSDEEFEKEVDWRFKFRERQFVDMDWIIPIIDAFEKEQCKKAALALDPARDSFRRRVGVRGFRLALLCTTLYPKVTPRAQATIIKFVEWWMNVDLENILKLLGEKYNEQTKKVIGFANADVFADLPNEFSKNDVVAVMRKQNKKTKVYDVIYRWKKLDAIEELDKGIYKKKKK